MAAPFAFETRSIPEAAREASRYMETKYRDASDETTSYVSFREDVERPDWVFDLVYDAHDVFGLMPDDRIWYVVDSALDLLATFDDDASEEAFDEACHEFADGMADVYTHDRLTWLASNLVRPSLVDEACEEFGCEEDRDTVERIGLGQFLEASRVWDSVVRSLREVVEDEDEDEGEAV